MTDWTNDDGILVRFGVDKSLGAQVGSAIASDGIRKEMVATLEVSRMALAGGLIGGKANSAIPAGALIESAKFIVTEAFVGATATLDLGLANADGTYTNLDEDGIDAAIAITAFDADDDVIVCDGALIGTRTAVAGYPSYDVDTAALTAGKGYLIITYIPAFNDENAAD